MVFPILNSKARKNTCSLFFSWLPGSDMFLVFLCLSWLAHLSLCQFLLTFPTSTDRVQSLDFCFPSLLTLLMILPSHMTFDIGWWLPHSYSSAELSPELQTCIFTCLVITSAQGTNRHLKLYIPSLLSYSLSLFNKCHSIFPIDWIQNCSVIDDSPLSHISSILSANSLSSIFKRYPKPDYFSLPPLLPPDAKQHCISPGFSL